MSILLLETPAKIRLLLAALLQVLLGLFDLVGVALSGITGSLAASLLMNQQSPMLVQKLLKYVHLQGQDPSTVILVFSLTALLFFVAKSLLAIYFSRRIFHFLAEQQAMLSANTLKNFFCADYIWIKNQNPHDVTMALQAGISAATINNLGHSILLFSEITLIFFFLVALIIANPWIALATIIYLMVIGYYLNYFITKKVGIYGHQMSSLTIDGQEMIFNSMSLFREIRILRRNDWFEQAIARSQKDYATTFADNLWIQQIPKYIMEIGLLLGVSGLLVISRLGSSNSSFLPILGIYIASAGRLFPALLRVQSSILSLRQSVSLSNRAFTLINQLNFSNRKYENLPAVVEKTKDESAFNNKDKSAILLSSTFIQVRNLDYCYPESKVTALKDVSFSINLGEHVVITGPSGAGKSTLCDLLLGLLNPSAGSINIDGLSGAEWVARNAGAVAYLPQDTMLISGSILENVCLGLPKNSINEDRVIEVLKQSQLSTYIEGLPLGIHTPLGEQTRRLSGGQRQRIGIARSLYSKPSLIIMDEATSALDAETEHAFMSLFDEIDEEISVILIAHRLSTVRNSKRILYFENGELLADGNFANVRQQAPNFENQARLSGL